MSFEFLLFRDPHSFCRPPLISDSLSLSLSLPDHFQNFHKCWRSREHLLYMVSRTPLGPRAEADLAPSTTSWTSFRLGSLRSNGLRGKWCNECLLGAKRLISLWITQCVSEELVDLLWGI